jgi:hypothetical protein
MPKKKTTAKKRVASKKTAKKPAKNLSLASKIKSPKVQLKNPRRLVVLSIIVFVLVGIAAWWQFIFADPSRVLSDMLVGSLRTPGVVKNVTQGSGPNSITQNTYLSFIDGPRSQSITTLNQQGASGTNQVVTENIGTPDEDYIRYRTIDITGANGKTDASAAENVWASRAKSGGQFPQQASFLNEGLLNAVAFGNFDGDQAGTLKQTIDELGIYSYSSVSRKFENGRLVYKYQVEFNPAALVDYLVEYSLLLGIDHKGQLDPANYKDAQPVQTVFTVDVLSRELVSIEYANTGRVEEYNGHGLKRPIEVPAETIAIAELQKRLQAAQ